MALPQNITPKTVTFGPAVHFDGTVAEGTVTITAPENVVNTTTNAPLYSSQMSKRLVDGMASFSLCPTDAEGLNIKSWTYKITTVISGALKQDDARWFVLPTAGPDEIDLDSLVTVPSSAGIPISVDVLTSEQLPAQMATVAADDDSAFAVAQRAAFAHLEDGVLVINGVPVAGGGGGGGLTLENVQDAVASMVLAGTNVTKVYDDAAGTLTLTAAGGSGGDTDPEVVRDTIAAALIAGSGVSITKDDAGDTITISATGGAGLPATIVNRTTAYTAAAGDFVLANAAGGGFTVTLPTSPANGALVIVKKVDTTAAVITVVPAGGGSIDGDPDATITSPQFGAILSHAGSNAWKVVAPTSAGGSNGVDGNTVRSGVGAPGAGLGVDGDFYINRSTAAIYGPKTAGAWGEPTPLVGPAGAAGGGPPGFIGGKWYAPDGLRGANGPPTLNRLTAVPMEIGAARAFDRISVYVTGGIASGLVRLGIYTDNAGRPDALVIDAGTVDASTNGQKDLVIDQTLSGQVWLVAAAQGATPQTVNYNVGIVGSPISSRVGTSSIDTATVPFGYTKTGVTGALAATWGATHTDLTSTAPVVFLRAA